MAQRILNSTEDKLKQENYIVVQIQSAISIFHSELQHELHLPTKSEVH